MSSAGWGLRAEVPRRLVLEVLAVGIPTAAVLFSQAPFEVPFLSALVACLVLPLRHRWPRGVLVLCLPGLAGGLGWVPTIVSLFRVGRLRPHFWPLVWWVLLVSSVALLPVLINESLGFGDLLVTVNFVLFSAGSPTALGALITTRQQLTASLDRLRQVTEAESAAKAEMARTEERSRIAREIHDAVGHHVTLIAVEAAALAATSEAPEAKASAGRLRGLAKEALAEMRNTLGLVAEESRAAGVDAIPQLVERTREAGVDVRLDSALPGDGDLAPGVGRAAYRVVQEALTNASKHAPGAEVIVRVGEDDGSVRISVVDEGVTGESLGVGSGGSGLAGLSERVRMAGGRLEANPLPNGGFELVAVLPRTGSPSAVVETS